MWPMSQSRVELVRLIGLGTLIFAVARYAVERWSTADTWKDVQTASAPSIQPGSFHSTGSEHRGVRVDHWQISRTGSGAGWIIPFGREFWQSQRHSNRNLATSPALPFSAAAVRNAIERVTHAFQQEASSEPHFVRGASYTVGLSSDGIDLISGAARSPEALTGSAEGVH